MRFAFFFISFILIAVTAFAATSQNPAYRTVNIENGFFWKDGITINFNPDVETCKKIYGKKWQEKCATAMGKSGKIARQIKMTPRAKGDWKWTGANSLVFTPANRDSLQSGKTYHIDISDLPHPGFVKLDKTSLTTTLPKMAVQRLASEFWIDPSSEGRHRLGASFQFNFPVANNGSKPAIELVGPASSSFGKPELVWNETGDKVNISWLVKNLAQDESEAKIYIAGFDQLISTQDGYKILPAKAKKGGATFLQRIPGETALFKVKKANLVATVDENLDRINILQIETSLLSTAQNILQNLQVFELPKYNANDATVPYNWSMAPALPMEVLKKSRKIRPVCLQNEESVSSRFEFRIDSAPNSYVFVILTDTQALSGNKLSKPFFTMQQTPASIHSLGFLQPGNILIVSESGIIDIYGTNLDKITWTAQKIRNPFLALITQTSYDTFSQPLSKNYLDMDMLSENQEGVIDLPKSAEGKAQFTTLDISRVLKQDNPNSSGLTMISLTGWKNNEVVANTSKLVLSTDLGIIIKQNMDGSRDCFVASLITEDPVEGADVNIIGANGLSIMKKNTDSQGHACFPPLDGLKREMRPVAVTANLNGKMAWLPLEESSRYINYTDFATGGNHINSNNVLAYFFNQRGVYRPGDTIYFGGLIRKANLGLLPEDTPFYVEIIDPRGMRFWDATLKSGENGLISTDCPTLDTSMSGKYTIQIRPAKNGELLSSCQFRIEDFIPETLKLKIDSPSYKGWLKTDKNIPDIKMTLQNLYGTPAQNHKLCASIQSRAPIFKFSGFDEFVFFDNAPFVGNGVEITLNEKMTDDEGKAEFIIPQEIFGQFSASYDIFGQGFESGGGRAVTSLSNFIASPMEKILGWRPLNSLTNLNFIPQGTTAELELIALNPDLENVVWNNLEAAFYKQNHITSLISDGNGGYRYDETPVSNALESMPCNVTENGSKLSLLTDLPGEYLLVIRDNQGKIVAQMPYAVAGNNIAHPDTDLAQGKMRVKLDKNSYKAGEALKIALSLPYEGYGLISLEREELKAFKWFKAPAGNTVQTIQIPHDFEGKGYIVVNFARSANSPQIYMQPLVWSAIPFTANIDKRNIKLNLEAAEKALPGEILNVKLSANEPGEAIVFAVDEGILQLDNFQTPKPLTYMLADRALDVRSIQALDLLMPDHALITRRISPFGGGMDGGAFGAHFQNPFKRKAEPPVVFWSKKIAVNSHGETVQIPIPDYYNGKIRIMAVGAGTESLGSAEKVVEISSPLILNPQFPLNVAPGDQFEAFISIENTTNQDQNITLNLKKNEYLELIDFAETDNKNKPENSGISNILPEYIIRAKSEKLFPIKFKTGDNPGLGKISIQACNKNFETKRDVEISVRPPSAYKTTAIAGKTDKQVLIDVPRDLYPLDASVSLSISCTPLPLLKGFSQYLENYPHGCTEQLISRSFSYVLMRPYLNAQDLEKSQNLFKATLTALRQRFNGDGLSLWPNGEANLLLTAYGLDLLLTMRESGLGAPMDLINQLSQALLYNCNLNQPTLSAARESAYAIWVLTRAGNITTQLLENLTDALEMVPDWKTDITALMIAASKKHMLVNIAPPSQLAYTSAGWFDEYAQMALAAAIMSRYFPENFSQQQKNDFFDNTAITLNDNNYASFSACQGIRGLISTSGNAAGSIIQSRLKCVEPDNLADFAILDKDFNGSILTAKSAECKRFILEPASSYPLYWQLSVTGYDRANTFTHNKTANSDSMDNKMLIEKSYLDKDGQPVAKIRQGDEVTISVKISGTPSISNTLMDCVITDLLPGGLEIIFPKGSQYAGNESNRNGNLPEAKFIDRKEDRILIFMDANSESQKFEWRARAVTPGEFVIPQATIEAMYNTAINGVSAPTKDKLVITR